MFDRFNKDAAAGRLFEEKIYEQIVQELAEGKIREGLWAKALADSNGMQNKAKALYLRYRAQSLKDELVEQVETVEQAKKSQPRQREKIPTKDPDYVLCYVCGFEQWKGYDKCQKCGGTLSS